MKLLWSYFKKQRRTAALICLLLLTFTGVYLLYLTPWEALRYALILCAVFAAAFFLIGFAGYRARHKTLEAVMKNLKTSVDGLPEPRDLLEADYQQLLRGLQREKSMALGERDRQQQDLNDYYTLWVHQIKTPISAIHLLLQEEDTALSRELTAQLFKIERYVEMVLAYLRMGSDSSDFVLRPCDLGRAVRQSVRKFAPMFIHGKVRLDLQPVELRVVTDEKWLCFALEQLLSNAIKYTPQGTVTVSCRNHVLSIRDTGMGIAPEDLPRVCEKGFTGYNGRQDKKASGIGLYLTNQILLKLGHRLTLESDLGKGTTASISFEMEEKKFE